MKIIVIDDDPTGSQTVKDCLLLLKWDSETLMKGLRSESNLFFILANTRALSQEHAKSRLNQICKTLISVIKNSFLKIEDFIFVSRGDSTLRGHNFLEPDVINELLGPFDATFHIPAFIEANRLTINGEHFVNKIPAHKTIFSEDAIFGYKTNNIKNLLYQKSNSKINLDQIQNLTILDLKQLKINKNNRTYQKIKNLKDNVHVIVDITNYSELNKFSELVRELQKEKQFLFRTSASFISSLCNSKKSNKLNSYYSTLRRKSNLNQFMNGLIVVGSIVDLTTKQLNNILNIHECKGIKLDVQNIYELFYLKNNQNQINFLKQTILKNVRDNLQKSYIPVIYTSRQLVSIKDKNQLVLFNNYLSSFIADLVLELQEEIGYLISKGGLTSNIILSKSFNVDCVYLEGQLSPGISVVTLKLEKSQERLPIVTFPGNIGQDDTLKNVLEIIENKKFLNFKNLKL